MTLEQKIEQIGILDGVHKTMGKRLEVLKTQVKAEIFAKAQPIPGSAYVTGGNGYMATLFIKQQSPKVDKVALTQLVVNKGLAADCMTLQIDEDLVEQLFIEGKLTDADLRSINDGSDITLALKVEKLEEKNV